MRRQTTIVVEASLTAVQKAVEISGKFAMFIPFIVQLVVTVIYPRNYRRQYIVSVSSFIFSSVWYGFSGECYYYKAVYQPVDSKHRNAMPNDDSGSLLNQQLKCSRMSKSSQNSVIFTPW